ncbi:lasso peptide biosynthesis B2 protein [Asticcacaulis excentricus]|nr:lasso peptide biosynthesis B2 protein [Asticcacaulis excentricus]
MAASPQTETVHPPAGYALAEGLSYCFVDGRVVFFDRSQNRYFASTSTGASALSRLLEGEALTCEDAMEIEALARNGVLRPQPRQGVIPPPTGYNLPTQSAPLSDAPSIAPYRARVLGTRLLVGLALRVLPLHTNLLWLIHRKRRAKRRPDTGTDSDLHALLGCFGGSRHLLSMNDQCLPTSLALCHFLLSYGHTADVVIGVRLRPFAAHAWVQRGEVLLSDTLENVRPFTPVAVI